MVNANEVIECDVAVIGGGPGGSTLGALLRKYDPRISVHIFEREKFPRDHIGESQLPPIGDVLEEMGCWDKVEAANFPIKIGATFRWGRTAELWDFEFLPVEEFHDEPRPAKYVGQRRQTAFQVDRSIYDQILLRHAEELGCVVREETQVVTVEHEGDRVTGLVLKSGQRVQARWYVDASGHVGLLRRALGVETTVPTALMNIAIWDYWQNAKWAVEIGVGGTRIQVMSQKHGWLWFIPLGPTRTSLGFVCPAEHYKSLNTTPEKLYDEVIAADPRIAALVADGTRRGRIETTKDWSFVSSRAFGENWFLVGEAVGFADPILSAGLTLTHTGARELAYTILALDRQEHDATWLKQHFESTQQKRVRQHIRFADFWYAANGQLVDLKDNCRKIASDAGLNLTSGAAWRWLAQGGFTNDVVGQAGIGGYDLAGMKQVTQLFTKLPAKWVLNDVNVLKLDLLGAKETTIPVYENGKIQAVKCYVRGERRLALTGLFATLVELLRLPTDVANLYNSLQHAFVQQLDPQHVGVAMQHHLQTLEVMLGDGWVIGKFDPRKPKLSMSTPDEGRIVHKHRDTAEDAVHPNPS
jgi:flavin-dependent dehydrogenase